MKTQISILKSFVVLVLLSLVSACNQNSIDPARILDEVFIPDGYRQIDNPTADALTRLEEFRLQNPADHYYYLERDNKEVGKSRAWIFPQNELKIEYADFDKTKTAEQDPVLNGIIVKKIKGTWQNEEFQYFDKQPAPENGMQALYNYISENLKYPILAKEKGIEGKVFVQFIVDKDGKLTEVKTIKGIGGGCDEEAVRVLKASPKWNPASVMGKPVKVRMILPISYKLS